MQPDKASAPETTEPPSTTSTEGGAACDAAGAADATGSAGAPGGAADVAPDVAPDVAAERKRSTRLTAVIIAITALGLCALIMLIPSVREAILPDATDKPSMEVTDKETEKVDYASNISILLQNELGLYSGCEIVSLAMTLNSMGIEVDPYEIANEYVEYANDYYMYSGYYGGGYGGYSGYGGYTGYGNDSFPPLDNRREALDSAAGDSRSSASSDEQSSATTDGEGGEQTVTASSEVASSESTDAQASQQSSAQKQPSITDYYIGDPYYSGMAYPPAIAKAANAVLADYGSQLVAEDKTGSSFDTLLGYLERGYPVIVWATLDYTDPLVSWTSLDQGDWLWYDNLHCVVLCGYNSETDTVTIADPLQGFIELPADDFEYVYDACGDMAVLIS